MQKGSTEIRGQDLIPSLSVSLALSLSVRNPYTCRRFTCHSVHAGTLIQPEALTEQSKSGGEERQTAATTAAGAGERRTGQDCEDDTANDTGSNVDPEEREKLERRRRRRPTVNLERYLNNTDDEGERKEHGGAGSTRCVSPAVYDSLDSYQLPSIV